MGRATIEFGLRRLSGALAGARVEAALARLKLLLRAGYRPDQPRVPAGNPDGGQWTDAPGRAGRSDTDGDGANNPDDLVHLVGRRVARRGNQIRVGDRWLEATPAQQLRAELSYKAMRKAVREAQTLNDTWRPRPQFYETVEGLIRANEATRLEAELYLYFQTGRPPRPGAFAHDWLTAPPSGLRLTAQQRRELDSIGQKFGCHGCGSTTNLTPRGHSVGDHQIPRSLGKADRIYPHCIYCSASQGGLINTYRQRFQP